MDILQSLLENINIIYKRKETIDKLLGKKNISDYDKRLLYIQIESMKYFIEIIKRINDEYPYNKYPQENFRYTTDFSEREFDELLTWRMNNISKFAEEDIHKRFMTQSKWSSLSPDQREFEYQKISDFFKERIDMIYGNATEQRKNLVCGCLELYEFELKGYPLYDSVELGPISDSPLSSCGIIDVAEGAVDSDRISSCDSLSSSPVLQKGGDVFTIQEFYDLYKKWKTKTPYDKTNKTYELLKGSVQSLLEDVQKINMSFIDKNKGNTIIPKYDTPELHAGGMIYKINVKNNEKIIIFGDFHGSYHTFLRHMFRLYKIGVIADMSTYKMSPGYKIIFLGDILDRGDYATEILLFVFNLMKTNNTSDELTVILNRGNHEEESIASTYGFKREIMKKLGTGVFQLFMNFMSTCPSAIVLENKITGKYWLSHGGIPLNQYEDTVVKIDDKKILYYGGSDDLGIPSQIRWNDFAYNEKEFKVYSDRGLGYVIYPKAVKQFLSTNNFQFIIRAHQDHPFNSYLLSTTNIKNNAHVIGNINNDGDDKIIFKNQKYVTEKPRRAVYGPITRITVKGQEWNNNKELGETLINNVIVFPVLTVSTNTDKDRPMKYDSFAILRFDLPKDKLGTFDKETNILDTRNEMKEISKIIKN